MDIGARWSNFRLRQPIVLLFVAYIAALAVLLPLLPLWLDEILELEGARTRSLPAVVRYAALNAGGVPLGYIFEWFSVHLFGLSEISGRLPSAVASLAALMGVYKLARPSGERAGIAAVCLFAILPLQLRYAVEARPYAQALSANIWATVVFLDLQRGYSRWLWVAYFLLVLFGLYTQPFTLFVPVVHFLSLIASRGRYGAASLLTTGAVLVAAIGAFLPWYRFAAGLWHKAASPYQFSFTAKSVALIVRELAGAGYIGTAIVLALAVIGFRTARRAALSAGFWVCSIAVPIVGAIIADACFGYFLAIRQMIFALPFVAVLAGVGISTLLENRTVWSRAAVSGAFAILAASSLGYFLKPHENWKSAAELLMRRVPSHAGCTIFVPASSKELFEFFEESLEQNECKPWNIGKAPAVAVAINPYDTSSLESVEHRLFEAGYRRSGDFEFEGPRVLLYRHEDGVVR